MSLLTSRTGAIGEGAQKWRGSNISKTLPQPLIKLMEFSPWGRNGSNVKKAI
jgi:hypothetical protein